MSWKYFNNYTFIHVKSNTFGNQYCPPRFFYTLAFIVIYGGVMTCQHYILVQKTLLEHFNQHKAGGVYFMEVFVYLSLDSKWTEFDLKMDLRVSGVRLIFPKNTHRQEGLAP